MELATPPPINNAIHPLNILEAYMTMLIDPKYQVATIEMDTRHSAAVICISYHLNSEKRIVAIEYWEVVTNMRDDSLNIPSNRMATFQEQLRVLKKAASFYEGPKDDENKQIEKKMKEAYGSESIVRFDPIPKTPL